jgi:hypothetical protein
MKLSMSKVLGVSLVALMALAPFASGCAAQASDDDQPAIEAGSEEAFTSSDRKAQLDALRVRVQADFARATSLRGNKLVFVVKKLTADSSRAVVFARIMKRDAAGHDSELAQADYKGSAYEELIADGVFDGPEVIAVLAKRDGKWAVMRKGSGESAQEAFVVGPTDVAYTDWDTEFGVPRAWFGL